MDLLSSAKSGGDKPLEEPTGSMSGGGLGVAPHRHIKVVLDGGGGWSPGAIGVSASARSSPLEVGVAMHCGDS